MKNKSVLGTLKFIFFTVILFVLTFSAVVVTILNIYVPTYRAKINGELVGYYQTEAEFDEVYAAISQEKATNGLEVKTYLESNPEFEMSYVTRSTIDEQNLYTELREVVKAEYTLYNVTVKGKKEMIFATKASADEYAKNLKKAVKGLKVEVKSEKENELTTVTETAKAKEIYKGLVSRYKPVSSYSGTVYAKPTQISYSTNKSISGGVRPASGIYTQFYGVRTSYGRHTGIDIAKRGNVAIYAYKAGTATWAGWKNGYGNLIIINNGDGVETYYAHLSVINVKIGETLEAGQQIGLMGSTGNSTGQHLHFEIRVNGQAINPYPYIK